MEPDPPTPKMCLSCTYRCGYEDHRGVITDNLLWHCLTVWHRACRDAWEAWACVDELPLCCRFCEKVDTGVDRTTYVCGSCELDTHKAMVYAEKILIRHREKRHTRGFDMFSGVRMTDWDRSITKTVAEMSLYVRNKSKGSSENVANIFEVVYGIDEMLEAFEADLRAHDSDLALCEEIRSAASGSDLPDIGKILGWFESYARICNEVWCAQFRLETAHHRVMSAGERSGRRVLYRATQTGYHYHMVRDGRCTCPD